MAKVKSKRYTGVYYEELQNGDKSYHITFKENNKKKWIKIGLHSEGIREAYCNNKRNEIVTKIRLGEDLPHVAKKNIKTLNEISKMCFDEKALHNKDNERSRSRFNKHFENTLGHLPLNKISKEHIQDLQKQKIQEKLAPKTINYMIAQLNSIYKWAIQNDIYKDKNPCENIENLKLDNKRIRYLELEEIKKLKKEIKENKYLYMFIMLSLATGGRLETICNIRPKNIKKDGIVDLYDFKNESWYIGFLDKEFLEQLKQFLKDENKQDNDLLLQATENPDYTSRYYQRRLKPILDKLFNSELDVKDAKNRVVIHTLRHTFASHLAINEAPILTIQKLMNHKDIESTMIYAKLSKNSGQDYVSKITQNMMSL